jgi:chromosome segregation ATPase
MSWALRGKRASTSELAWPDSYVVELTPRLRRRVRELERLLEGSTSAAAGATGENEVGRSAATLEALLADMTRSRDRLRGEAAVAERAAKRARAEVEALKAGVEARVGADGREGVDKEVEKLKEEVQALREKDRHHLEDIRRYVIKTPSDRPRPTRGGAEFRANGVDGADVPGS